MMKTIGRYWSCTGGEKLLTYYVPYMSTDDWVTGSNIVSSSTLGTIALEILTALKFENGTSSLIF